MKKHENNQLVELVNLFHAYEQENPDHSIADFCRFYLASETEQKPKQYPSTSIQWKDNQFLPINGLLGRALGRLSGFTSFYWKKALENTALSSSEDFAYLAATTELGNPTKSELIQYCISEFPTGIEVIKRLVKKGFLTEYPDAYDKRSKRIEITPQGLETLRTLAGKIFRIGDVLFDSITEPEKEIILQILSKMEKAHSQKYVERRKQTIDEIYQGLSDPEK